MRGNAIACRVLLAGLTASGWMCPAACRQPPIGGTSWGGRRITGPTLHKAKPGPVNIRSLLGEMTDLANLAEFPDPPYTCKQFSSYDPASISPQQRGWFANADRGHFLRVEERADRKEYVMLDADGPGAIVRIWSANPEGTMRIYLDHSKEPTLEAPMTELLGGTMPGVPAPIAGERSRGWNCYFPFPYARHCKITSDNGDLYYHVNYRTYWAGTEVETFRLGMLDELAEEIDAVAQALSKPKDATSVPPAAVRTSSTFAIAPGASYAVAQFEGPKYIFEFIVQLSYGGTAEALRGLALTMTFDGEETVAAPLGDFFGAAPGINPYDSLPVTVEKDGVMRARWVMPFEKSAKIRIHNWSDRQVVVSAEYAAAPYTWTERSMHFSAKWRTEFDVPTRPKRDWNYLSVGGRGVFCGAALAIANPVRVWWGEGDEKIYVDGETFPSHFGTGTEDYFGYAWCSNEPFTSAYHNQPRCDGPANYGHTAVNRWHVMDRIPFTKDFRFDMELWHWEDTKVDMSVVTYWYARPGGADAFPPIKPSDLRLVELPEYEPPRVEGAIEGETMRVIEKTGCAGWQAIPGCSNDQHFWWRRGQPGDKLVLGFDVPQAGTWRVFARFVKALDYGIVQLSINGKDVGQPLDLFNNGVLVCEEVDLGVIDLTQGENRLKATIIGANDQAVREYMFGLDYVRLGKP